MIPLLDINAVMAISWASHVNYALACHWFAGIKEFATCTTVQTGFLRVSLSPAFHASQADAIALLEDLLKHPGHRFISDSTQAVDLPFVQGNKEVTDAHLVCLARSHGLKLATLDKPLCGKSWAKDVAVLIE